MIRMAGIDFHGAEIAVRESFALQPEQIPPVLARMRELIPSLQGCVVLSTCNRTECWVEDGGEADLPRAFCRALQREDASLFILWKEEAAVSHLFKTACGRNSLLPGDDQILSQVRQAAELSREAGFLSPVLDRLFRQAVTTAKQIKTSCTVQRVPVSAASAAVALLSSRENLAGKQYLVIGNGKIGQLAAEKLLKSGAAVTMTVRQYHHGDVCIPRGCRAVLYEERYTRIPPMDGVISATASPHYTLTDEKLTLLPKPYTFVDLAVPRDLDPAIARRENVRLYHLDDLRVPAVPPDPQEEALLTQGEKEFLLWQQHHGDYSVLRQIEKDASREILWRIRGEQKKPDPQIEQAVRKAAEKTVGKLLRQMQQHLSAQCWEECLQLWQRGDMDWLGEAVYNPPEKKPQPVLSRETTRFPLFLSLQGQPALVVGGGKIAARRVQTLLQCGACITVVAPKICSEILEEEEKGRLRVQRRCYRPGEESGYCLCTAVTNDRSVNRLVGENCRKDGIPVSVADNQNECSFFFPALIAAPPYTIGLTSGGENHEGLREMAGALRRWIKEYTGENDDENLENRNPGEPAGHGADRPYSPEHPGENAGDSL